MAEVPENEGMGSLKSENSQKSEKAHSSSSRQENSDVPKQLVQNSLIFAAVVLAVVSIITLILIDQQAKKIKIQEEKLAELEDIYKRESAAASPSVSGRMGDNTAEGRSNTDDSSGTINTATTITTVTTTASPFDLAAILSDLEIKNSENIKLIGTAKNETEELETRNNQMMQDVKDVTNDLDRITNKLTTLDGNIDEESVALTNMQQDTQENKNTLKTIKEQVTSFEDENVDEKTSNITDEISNLNDLMASSEATLKRKFENIYAEKETFIEENKNASTEVQNTTTFLEKDFGPDKTFRQNVNNATNEINKLNATLNNMKSEVTEGYEGNLTSMKNELAEILTANQGWKTRADNELSEHNTNNATLQGKISNVTSSLDKAREKAHLTCLRGLIYDDRCIQIPYNYGSHKVNFQQASEMCLADLGELTDNTMYDYLYEYVQKSWIYDDVDLIYLWLGSSYQPADNSARQITLAAGGSVDLPDTRWYPDYPSSGTSHTRMVLVVRKEGDSSTYKGLQNRDPTVRLDNMIPICGRDI